MQELKALDKLAAIRFASVYQAFETTGDYAVFIESLEAEPESE